MEDEIVSRESSQHLLLIAACALAALAGVARASTIRVDVAGGGDYLTIQEGLDTASPGDSVLVAAGVYYEHLTMGATHDGVWIISADGPAATIVDGQDLTTEGPLLHVEESAVQVLVSGFTFRNNHVLGSSWGGGAIFLDHCVARVEGNIMEDCRASWDGGGVYALFAESEIVGNTIRFCHASIGAGVSVIGGTVLISHNDIIDNEVYGWDTHWAGGIYLDGVEAAQVLSNTISRNSTQGQAGGLYARFSVVTIEDNVITDNRAGSTSAILFASVSTAFVSGNVISGNGPYTSGQVTALAHLDGGSVHYENNIITNNAGPALWIAGSLLPVMHGCHIEGNDGLAVVVTASAAAGTLDMTGNWWGTTDPEEIGAFIYDCADNVAISACVDFEEWCIDPSCSGDVTSVPGGEQEETSWGRLKSLYR